MQSLVLLGLLGAQQVLAHPTHQTKPGQGISRRTVNLDNYRLKVSPEYTNSEQTTSDAKLKFVKREDYVSTATALVQSILPGVEFRVADDHYVGTNGIAHVNFKQTLHGLDIDNADFNVNIGKDGQVFSYGNNFYTGTVPVNPLVKRAFSEPSAALAGAASILELPVSGAATAEATDRIETYKLTGTSGAVSDPEARLVYFVKEDNTLALTWRVETDVMDDWLLTYVDAETNEEVYAAVNYVAHASATYQVYKWGLNDPNEGSRTVITDPWLTSANPFTWQGDGTSVFNSTWGNNGIAQVNPSGSTSSTAYLTNYRPSSATSDFEYAYTPSTTTPTTYRDASIVQLFYTANKYHDLLYTLGFTEAAGNFQINNNGKGGKANDPVILNAQDGAGTDNADFATPVDGSMPRMRMYIWDYTSPKRDCTFEAGVIIHEYTHGLSNRLTGGPANSGCLSITEAGGMGEGWGDFMATAIRLKSTDTRATNYPMGAWVYGQTAGIRSYVYSTSLTTNPLTYTSLNSLNEVHAIGTAWATILYELLWNLIDAHGGSLTSDFPTFNAQGVPNEGKFLTMKLVADAMALQPCNPNFIQARDAILDADTALTGGANKCAIWTAFAKRGVGQGAVYSTSRRTGSTVIPSGVC
ncbi:hypothetical protein GQ53DRAFT_791993 [Thozetella sp. PMI_491]|nr:hypothetical protein GQ53DRAFT_791993 [Thozetella sp. PMI_491]